VQVAEQSDTNKQLTGAKQQIGYLEQQLNEVRRASSHRANRAILHSQPTCLLLDD
jgi:hypothetical protein